MKKISILGCGWLGLPLAKKFSQSGFEVKGSTTTPSKLQILAESGINAYQIMLAGETVHGNVSGFLECDILIIDIPPKLRAAEADSFTEKLKRLLPVIEKSKVEKVIFVSSISVYGKNAGIITENTIPIPATESGRQLLECENLLFSNSNFDTTILRLGGLIGADRHPIYSLSGKKNLTEPFAAVNLIHQTDCIGLIMAVIRNDAWNMIFNGVAPFHPSRKEYYTQIALKHGLEIPEFNESDNNEGKIIVSDISTLSRFSFGNHYE